MEENSDKDDLYSSSDLEDIKEQFMNDEQNDLDLKKLGHLKLMLISIFWFSNTVFTTGMFVILIPRYVDTIATESNKGKILGKKKKFFFISLNKNQIFLILVIFIWIFF